MQLSCAIDTDSRAIVVRYAQKIVFVFFDNHEEMVYNSTINRKPPAKPKRLQTITAGKSKEIMIMKEQKNNHSAGFKKAIAVVLMGAICMTAAVSVGSLTKNVTVTDGNEKVSIDTINPDTDAILSKTGVELGENDKLVRTDDGKNGVNISIIRAFDVESSDGSTAVVDESSVADSLLSAGMTLSENDSFSLAQAIESIGAETEVKLARFQITVDVRGEKVTKYVPAGTVKSALEFLGVELNDNDIVSVDINTNVKEGLEVEIKNVEVKTVTKTETIDYETIYKDSDDLYIGTTETETYGVEGERTIVTEEKYVNGVLESSEGISSEVTKEPVDAVILNGTKEQETASSSISYDYTYPGDGHLTNMSGIYYGPSGLETYYNLPMEGVVGVMRNLGYDEVNYPYWVRDDGCKMLGNYIMVAADYSIRPRGTIVPTSLGAGIVCDTGGFIYNNPLQLDIATAW